MHATRIIAIRHGETAWNVDTRIQGHLDIPLNTTGLWQADQVAQALVGEPIAAIYTSDLQRAHATAQAVARTTGAPLVADPGLRVEIVTRFGGVVADSAATVGKNFDNFKALTEGNLKLPAGEYFLKVTHAKGTARDEKGKVVEDKNYAMQLSMGVYRRDYDTVAQQPQAGDGIPQQSQSQIELMTMLQTQSYTDFGLSGTQKLSNALLG